MEIRVDTTDFERTRGYGPRGSSVWVFRLEADDGRSVDIEEYGLYAGALDRARRFAREWFFDAAEVVIRVQ